MIGSFEYTPWIWPMLASAAFIAAVGAYVWRRRRTPGALPLALAAVIMTVWCLAGAVEISATGQSSQRPWLATRDIIALPGAVLALWFAVEYAGLRRLLTRPVVAFLIASVLIHTALGLVDEGRLLSSRVQLEAPISVELAPIGLLFDVYGLGLFLLSTVVMVVLFIGSPPHRPPIALILLGHVGVRAVYPLGALQIAYPANIVVIALALDVVTLMYVIALSRFRLFDPVPVAREAIIDQMPDAMVVLDTAGRIADVNRAAELLLEIPRPQVLGRPLAGVLEAVAHGGAGDDEVILQGNGFDGRRCQITTTLLADWQGSPIGRLVMLHDITELRQAEEQLLEHERTLAAAREREHMAHELHDSVGQVLSYVAMQADAARKLGTDGKAGDADARLERLAAVAREAHADVRAHIHELRDPASEFRPLTATLRSYLEGFGRNHGIGTQLSIDPRFDDGALGIDQQVQLLRIAQEALTNARKHGEAREVSVELAVLDGNVRLVVADDGSGFDARSAGVSVDGRYGLQFMHERATQLHGNLEVESAPGEGTRVTVSVPLAHASPSIHAAEVVLS
jgi:signal transduction histidine kinase